jgi:hypothetical protein
MYHLEVLCYSEAMAVFLLSSFFPFLLLMLYLDVAATHEKKIVFFKKNGSSVKL